MNKKIAFIATIFVLLAFNIFQGVVINSQKKELDEWVQLEKLWREKMDTCAERNARIYDELFKLQEYKIMKLKEDKIIE